MTTRQNKPASPATPAAKKKAAEALAARAKEQTAKAVQHIAKRTAASVASRKKKPGEKMRPEDAIAKAVASRKKPVQPVDPRTAPRKAEKPSKGQFQPGNTVGKEREVNAASGSLGDVKTSLTAQKLRLMATTGMTPLEFLTAVYRDQLYDNYDIEIVDEKRGHAQFFPSSDPMTGNLTCKKVDLKIEQRIAAATSAAPYVHRKMPIGIDGGPGKPLTVLTADKLAELSDDKLNDLLGIFGKLGIGAEFEGGAQRPYGIDDDAANPVEK